MITLNGTKIRPIIFPDKTSQVWKVEGIGPNCWTQRITWDFENEAEFMHLAQLVDLLKAEAPESWIELTIPYLPYARQDKAVSNSATFALRTFCKLLNTLDVKEIIYFDGHSDVPLALLKKASPFFPMERFNMALKMCEADTIAFPDAGANNRYKVDSNLHRIVAEKTRNQETGYIEKYEITEGHPEGRKILIVDDICDGGMTFKLLAESLLDRGAKEVNLYVTHGIFSKGVQTLKDSGINRVFTYKGEI